MTGIDAANRPGHSALLNALMNRSADRAPLNMRVISGELVLPVKVGRTMSHETLVNHKCDKTVTCFLPLHFLIAYCCKMKPNMKPANEWYVQDCRERDKFVNVFGREKAKMD